jgi:hypothetical protein
MPSQGLTLRDLFVSSTKLSPSRSSAPSQSPDIKLDKVIPFAGAKMCLFQISMRGVTQQGVRHRVNILATGIDVTRQDTSDPNKFKFNDKDGDFWIPKIDPVKSPVKVRCSCHDHYFTWGIWNFNNDAKPRPYKRLTPAPPVGYPYRNPKQLPGICKHIRNAVTRLQNMGLFK